MANISIDYSILTCNLLALDDASDAWLRQVYPALEEYLGREHAGTKIGAKQPKLCDIELTNDTDADYLIAIGDGSRASLDRLEELLEEKPRQTLLFAIMIGAEDIKAPCTTFITEECRAEELLYDISSLIAVRRYCNTTFEKVFDFFGDLGAIKGYRYDRRLSPSDFEGCRRCWVTISRPDENLTADTTLLDEVLLLLPDDCVIMWNMRACNKGERGVSVRLYC